MSNLPFVTPQRILASAGLLVFALWGCDSSQPGGSLGAPCSLTFECEAGLICDEGLCAEPVPGDPNGPGEPGEPSDPSDPNDPNGPGGPGGPGGPDDPTDPSDDTSFGTPDYRRCASDLDCQVFGGNCLTELTLNRPDLDGRTKVSVSSLSGGTIPAGEGICSLACTSEPSVCSSLRTNAPAGVSASWTCQLVFSGESPYTYAQDNASALDHTAMNRGIAFASICRPPFQFAEERDDLFCQSCTEDAQCGDAGACHLTTPYSTSPAGVCVESCDAQSDCPFGFTCEARSGDPQTYCLPIEGTCGACLDQDGDQRGVGRCGPSTAPFTDVDCDDSAADTFYDAQNMNHPFPGYCGPLDKNCNLVPDDVDQAGGQYHCGGCGNVCNGSIGTPANGRWGCLLDDASQSYACETVCNNGWVDCDGLPGCEENVVAAGAWYLDADGDGFGTRASAQYYCADRVPANRTQTPGDCNDNDALTYPGAIELCDGVDNNCDNLVDNDVNDPDLDAACENENNQGICREGALTCEQGANGGTLVCNSFVAPETVATALEICNGLDDNCNGRVDEGIPSAGFCTITHYQNTPVYGDCANGLLQCVAGSTQCIPGVHFEDVQGEFDEVDDDNIDSNCDGMDGDIRNGIFVREAGAPNSLEGHDTHSGTKDRPVATIQRAIDLACAGGATTGVCKDIYVAKGTYESSSAIEIPTWAANFTRPPVRIYGGYTPTFGQCDYTVCDVRWERKGEATTLVRTAPAANFAQSYPYGESYSAIQAKDTTGPMSLLLWGVSVRVQRPSGSLSGEQHAPSMVGIECPPQGCGLLTFNTTAIDIATPLAGGNGEMPDQSASNGTNGKASQLGSGSRKQALYIVKANQNSLQYSLNDYNANYFGGRGADCYDPVTNTHFEAFGGNSGGLGIFNEDTTNGGYSRQQHYLPIQLTTPKISLSISDLWKASNSDDGRTYGSAQRGAGRAHTPGGDLNNARGGTHGVGGRGGSIVLSNVAPTSESGARTHFSRKFTSQVPTQGGLGAGGAGGEGYAWIDDNKDSEDGQNQFARGPGGGSGGCGGAAGTNGGNGGSAIGILLVVAQNGSTRMEIAPFTVGGPFFPVDGSRLGLSVKTNGAGAGGQGSSGANGGTGGMPGNQMMIQGNASNPDASTGVGFVNDWNTRDVIYRDQANSSPTRINNWNYRHMIGGYGGSGGGGGGGAGGIAGVEFGIYVSCTAAQASDGRCNVQAPAVFTQMPSAIINTSSGPASAGGAGNGGEYTHPSNQTGVVEFNQSAAMPRQRASLTCGGRFSTRCNTSTGEAGTTGAAGEVTTVKHCILNAGGACQ